MARPRTRARRSSWGTIRPRRRADGSTVWEFEPPRRLGLRGESGTFKTREAAERRRDELRASLEQATYVPSEAGKELVREWGEQWLATLRGEDSSRDNRRSNLNAWIYPAWGDRGLKDVSTLDVEILLADAERQGRAPYTLSKLWQTMDMMFSSAVANKKIPANPCDGVRKRARPTQERLRDPRMLDQEQKIALHAAAPAGRDRLVLDIAFRMGLRSQEIAALEGNDVSVRSGVTWLNIDAARSSKGKQLKRTKSRAGKRELFVWPDLAADLHAYISTRRPGPRDLLFLDDNGFMMSRWFINDRIWQPAAQAAGIPHGPGGYLFKDLRNTCVMDLLNAKNPPHQVMEWIGHSTQRLVMEVYNVMQKEGLIAMLHNAPPSPARHLRAVNEDDE